jgi:dipeptidyl aminopeptidase/acylaminoacyl peptidase
MIGVRQCRPLVWLLFLAAGLRAQEAPTLPVPDNLVVEGIPAIPAGLPGDVRRYTEARAAALSDWHPTRREMLITTRFGNTAQVHAVRMPLGARLQLTFFDEPVGGARYEPNQGRYFVFGKDVGGNEFVQLYSYDLAAGRATLLTDGGRSQNGGVTWNHAGDRIAYGSTRRNGADRDLYVMDPANPSSDHRVLEVSGGGWSVLDWSPDDRQLLVTQYLSVNQSFLWVIDAATGAKTALLPPGADTVAYGGAMFGADGRGVYLTSDQGTEFQQLAYFDFASKTLTPLTAAIPWDVDEFDVSPGGGQVAFVTNEAGMSKLYLLDATTRRYRQVPGLPIGVLGGLRWHRSGRDLGFTLGTPRFPGDVYSIDARTGALTRWTESELGGLAAAELPEPALIRWAGADGREITGFLYRPPARFTGPRPVIISIHGGPEGQSRPGFLGRDNFFLSELGAVVIHPNVRGSIGYGKTFVKLDNGPRRMDAVADIGALLDWIGRQPDLDAAHVMVTGGSYGGFMTLAVATTYNDRIACALDVVGISNFNTFLRNTESYRRDLRRVEYGDERDSAMAAYFERTAPLNNAGRITKPLFVVQGRNDPRVPHTEALQMIARVKQNGSPVWFLMANDEGHGFRKKGNRDYQFYATVLFVRRFLLPAGTS